MKRTTPEFDQRQIDAGKAAESFLRDDTFLAAMKSARERITAKWVRADNLTEREELHGSIVGLNAVVAELRATMGGGKHAQHLKEADEALPKTTGE